jgi:hypothetical protein
LRANNFSFFSFFFILKQMRLQLTAQLAELQQKTTRQELSIKALQGALARAKQQLVAAGVTGPSAAAAAAAGTTGETAAAAGTTGVRKAVDAPESEPAAKQIRRPTVSRFEYYYYSMLFLIWLSMVFVCVCVC